MAEQGQGHGRHWDMLWMWHHSLIPYSAQDSLHLTPGGGSEQSPAAASAPNLHSYGKSLWHEWRKGIHEEFIFSSWAQVSFPASQCCCCRSSTSGGDQGGEGTENCPKKSPLAPKPSRDGERWQSLVIPTALSHPPKPRLSSTGSAAG